MDITAISRRLRSPQVSTIKNLDDSFAILGCSEPYAIRLAKCTAARPALVEMKVDPVEGKMFRLTEAGMLVRKVLP